MAKATLLVTGALAVAALGSQMSTAHATHSWGGYHWQQTSSVVSLGLGNNLSDSWKPYLETASKEWSMEGSLPTSSSLRTVNKLTDYPTNLKVIQTNVVRGTARRNCKATAGKVEVCNSKYGNNGWLGLAQIWISGGHITQGVAKMNDTYFTTGTYNKREWKNLVMCQEVAHTFGLGHNNEVFDDPNKGTCMDYTSSPLGPPSNEFPNLHDYDQLKLIYNQHDGSSTSNITMKSPRGFQFAAYVRDDPEKDWGKAVAFTSKGQPRLFVKDLGQGNKRITHVFWTEDARPGQHFHDHAE